jgi:hypothetical protein
MKNKPGAVSFSIYTCPGSHDTLFCSDIKGDMDNAER